GLPGINVEATKWKMQGQKVEQSRLDYIHKHQNDLRSDYLSGLYDAVSRGDHEGITAGSKIMLPSTFIGGPRLDNCNVVSYNRSLSLAFEAHINVEYYDWSMLFKYLFKYISKGSDRILSKVSMSNREVSTSTAVNSVQIDKIQDYVGGRFICLFEACWRIYDFPIHGRELAMQILNVYLEDMQRVSFRERDMLDIIVNLPEKKKITLTEWFVYNNEHTDGRHLTYLNFPSEFMWRPFLLPDAAMSPERISGSSTEIRTLFAQILIYCDVADPGKLWTKHWQTMHDDIPTKVSKAIGIPNYHVNTAELQGSPPQHLLEDLKNKLLMEEKNYKRDLLMQEVIHSVPKLNHDQKKKIYDLIINASATNQQELLFIYGHGGTGKTFLWKKIISSLRSQGKIVLAVASSGIASLLLPTCRTTHSRFKLPLELTDESLCHAKKKSNGEIGEPDEEENHDSSWTINPPEYCVTVDETGMAELIDFIYDEAMLKTPITGEGHSKTYLSIDEAIPIGRETSETEMLYPMEYLNTITFLGFSSHELQLKVGSPIMLLRNVNLSGGLCNGTRMIAIKENVRQHYCIPQNRTRKLHSRGKSIPKMDFQKYSRHETTGILMHSNRQTANMDINNIDYFNPLLKPGTVYRFSNFIYETTNPYHQTLVNKVSLKFGKITRFDILTEKESEFPEHHFEFIAYNQLASKVPYQDENSKMIYPVLTGCIRSNNNVTPFGDANTCQKYLRKVDIENLDGNIVEFTMWDELVKQFNKAKNRKDKSPVIIVVSSCRVTKYKATPATYYYINPRIPEAEYAHTA
ncbi:DNA helicase, partial [Tanacetum coccineum]